MKETGHKNPSADLFKLNIMNPENVFWNLTPEELMEHSVQKKQGVISDSGALVIMTGEFTGRSPKDRFIVKDDVTKDTVDWGDINLPFEPTNFAKLESKIEKYFDGKDVYVRDVKACANPRHSLKIRLVAEYPWSSQFASNMFLRLTKEEISAFDPEWVILCAPGCMADPKEHGTRQHNFAIINFSKKKIIIGGTGYTGEIKKGIFSVLNYYLPQEKGILSMHCSANVGVNGDTSVFFGLSGTGKTTLSTDPDRKLIGDDEHGWSNSGVFNFEGGCYAKTIDLAEEKEPEIFNAIRHGAILENIQFHEGTRTPNYEDTKITQNTRVSYPIHHIDNIMVPSRGPHPNNIFFLTADALGVLPPIAKLDRGQIMYHFISGYTAKVAGTEAGVVDPTLTFSACFGAPFLPLHPTQYAEMLAKKIEQYNVNVWLINTGWSGGSFGVGKRMKLSYTRAMISAAMEGKLDNVGYVKHKVFGLMMPTSCPDVPAELLYPKHTWEDKDDYNKKANDLATAFNNNFEKYADKASEEMLAAAPVVRKLV